MGMTRRNFLCVCVRVHTSFFEFVRDTTHGRYSASFAILQHSYMLVMLVLQPKSKSWSIPAICGKHMWMKLITPHQGETHHPLILVPLVPPTSSFRSPVVSGRNAGVTWKIMKNHLSGKFSLSYIQEHLTFSYHEQTPLSYQIYQISIVHETMHYVSLCHYAVFTHIRFRGTKNGQDKRNSLKRGSFMDSMRAKQLQRRVTFWLWASLQMQMMGFRVFLIILHWALPAADFVHVSAGGS